MSDDQRTVLTITALTCAVMLLFPPIQVCNEVSCANLGFDLILEIRPTANGLRPSVNSAQLIVQWLGVGMVGSILYFAVKK